MKKPFEMTFAEFVEDARPSGAVTRLPEMNRGLPVHSYSVYLNGPAAADLPEKAKNAEFKDVMVTALTRQLGLDHRSFRDNLKVCELVAARAAWLECVNAEHRRNRAWGLDDLPGNVLNDYEVLSKGMTHPFIQAELGKQKNFAKGLSSVLNDASKKTGQAVADLAPDQVSIGKVVSQNMDFTVQETRNGEIVTHENRRLESMPKVGTEISVSYYRGSGQVVDSLEKMKASAPFIEKTSGDLAIKLADRQGREQIVLFGSMTGFDRFVREHGLSSDLVRQAMDARAATPKVLAPVAKRDIVEIYIEKESGCLALDYKENGAVYSALFKDAQAMEACAKEFGLASAAIAAAKALDMGRREFKAVDEENSLAELAEKIKSVPGAQHVEDAAVNRIYTGRIVAESGLHVAQNTGQWVVVVHDLRKLDKVPKTGDFLTAKYKNDRAQVNFIRRDAGLER